MPNTSAKDFDRRYSAGRRKSSDEEHYSKNQLSNYDDFSQNITKSMYRNSSREKKSSSSLQSTSSSDIKQPIRSFGDWSEFMSSTGKVYYYNCKTEKAQWDKPDGWEWLQMQEEKNSKNYYAPASKEYRNVSRYRNKYENDSFDLPSSMKPLRYSSYDNPKSYQRDYSNDYMNSNQPTSSFRSSHYTHNLNDQQHRTYSSSNSSSNNNINSANSNSGGTNTSNQPIQQFQQQTQSQQQQPLHPSSLSMQDYYESNQNYQSSSSNDYYNHSYRNHNFQTQSSKEWSNESHQARFQSSQIPKIQNFLPNNTNSSNNNSQKSSSVFIFRDDDYKLSPRYNLNNYDEPTSNKPYNNLQQKHHQSRYESYNDSNFNKYSYNNQSSRNTINSLPSNSNMSADPYSNSNNRNGYSSNFSNDFESNQSDKYTNKNQHQPSLQTDLNNENSSRNCNRSRSSSENNLSPKNNLKKFKKSEDRPNSSQTQSSSKTVDEENWDESPVKQAPLDENVNLKNEEKNASEKSNVTEKSIPTSKLVNEPVDNAKKANYEKFTTNIETTKLEEVKKDHDESTAPSNNKPIEETKENLSQKLNSTLSNQTSTQYIQALNGPVLSSTVDDINKYYRPDLAARLTSCLGVVENLSWLNQPYLKHFSFSNLGVEIKNYRSVVRLKEIKKTLQEQRLHFLQAQMKEVDELLS